MNIGSGLVASLLDNGLPFLKQVKAAGITPDDVNDSARPALAFVYDYAEKYKTCPPRDLVVQHCGIDLDVPIGKAAFHLNQVIEKRLYHKLQLNYQRGISMLEKNEIREALALTRTLAKELTRESLISKPVVELATVFPSVLQRYEDLKAGKRGVLTRWPTINQSTFGFWNKEMILFVARLGVGKTFAATMVAHDAWAGECRIFKNGKSIKHEQKKHKVLFISPEMDQLIIASRFIGLRKRLPYARIKNGNLNPWQEKVFREGLEELRDAKDFKICGGKDFDFTLAAVEAAIEEAEPEFIVLDGVYLFRGQGQSRTDRAAFIFEELTRILARYDLPGFCTSQLNRTANQNQAESVTAASIALSDVAGWNTSYAVGMIQTDDMRRDNRMMFKPLKIREGSSREFESHWDFRTMNFDEIEGTPGESNPFDGDANEDGIPQNVIPFSSPENDDINF